MAKFSHTDESGRATMVDVSGKPNQRRRAVASGEIFLAEDTIALIRDNSIKKGDVLTVAQIAGIGAAKQTGSLIPLCHPLGLERESLPGGLQRLTYATTEPLPTYLIAFAVGPLDVIEHAPVPANDYRSAPLPLRGVAARDRVMALTICALPERPAHSHFVLNFPQQPAHFSSRVGDPTTALR